MFNAIRGCDLRALAGLDPDELSKPDVKKNRTVLHRVARNHNLDFLFACICLGCKQTVRDYSGKLFSDYLDKWEYDYIKQRYEAWKLGKVWVNVYRDTFEGYLSYGYSCSGEPMLSIVWKHNLGIETLEHILNAGVDLDQMRNVDPPQEYRDVLARYGWVPTQNRGFVQNELDNYYPPHLWTSLQREQHFTVRPIGETPIGLLGKVVVCISDTHWDHRKLHLPDGDFLICSGDLCMPWHNDLTDYLLWMGNQTHTYKILVAGNHDKLLQNNKDRYLKICKEQGIIYLEDSGIEIKGIKFWGSPWTPKRPRTKNNAFTLSRTELMKKWNMIPADINVLITHCPPYGIGDCNTDFYKGPSYQGGDFGLYKTINRLPQLQLHTFGHQHFGRGLYKGDNGVYFANSAIAIAHDPTAYVFT